MKRRTSKWSAGVARRLAACLAVAVAAGALTNATGWAQDAKKPAAAPAQSKPAAAPAQNKPAAAPAQNKSAEDAAKNSAWIKLCNQDEDLKKEICVVTQELREANSGRLLASASIRMVEGEKTNMIFAVPVGMMLRPGVQVQIDKDKPRISRYTVCFPNACVAGMEVDDEYIAALKRGGDLFVAVMKPDQKPVAFPLTLAGFTKAFDGPPTDPKLFEQGQKNLAEAIARRAKEDREKAEKEKPAGQGEAQPKAQ